MHYLERRRSKVFQTLLFLIEFSLVFPYRDIFMSSNSHCSDSSLFLCSALKSMKTLSRKNFYRSLLILSTRILAIKVQSTFRHYISTYLTFFRSRHFFARKMQKRRVIAATIGLLILAFFDCCMPCINAMLRRSRRKQHKKWFKKEDVEIGRPRLDQKALADIASFNHAKEYIDSVELFQQEAYVYFALVGLCCAKSLNKHSSHLDQILKQGPGLNRNYISEPQKKAESERRQSLT